MTSQFWLIRHGEPDGEVRQRCYGSLDVGLSENGRVQMAQAAEDLRTEPIATIYSSPLSRALESARILAALQSCPIEIVTALREMDFGLFEGVPYDEIAERYPDIYKEWMAAPTRVRFPNGENFMEMRGRVLGAFEKIQGERQGETVAIVSHGGVNRILIAWALQMPEPSIFRLAQDYGAKNLLSVVDGVPSLQLMNQRHSNR